MNRQTFGASGPISVPRTTRSKPAARSRTGRQQASVFGATSGNSTLSAAERRAGARQRNADRLEAQAVLGVGVAQTQPLPSNAAGGSPDRAFENMRAPQIQRSRKPKGPQHDSSSLAAEADEMETRLRELRTSMGKEKAKRDAKFASTGSHWGSSHSIKAKQPKGARRAAAAQREAAAAERRGRNRKLLAQQRQPQQSEPQQHAGRELPGERRRPERPVSNAVPGKTLQSKGSRAPPTFLPSEEFEGLKNGYAYKAGEKGVGYYADPTAVVGPPQPQQQQHASPVRDDHPALAQARALRLGPETDYTTIGAEPFDLAATFGGNTRSSLLDPESPARAQLQQQAQQGQQAAQREGQSDFGAYAGPAQGVHDGGEYDEAASRSSFLSALADWRSGGATTDPAFAAGGVRSSQVGAQVVSPSAPAPMKEPSQHSSLRAQFGASSSSSSGGTDTGTGTGTGTGMDSGMGTDGEFDEAAGRASFLAARASFLGGAGSKAGAAGAQAGAALAQARAVTPRTRARQLAAGGVQTESKPLYRGAGRPPSPRTGKKSYFEEMMMAKKKQEEAARRTKVSDAKVSGELQTARKAQQEREAELAEIRRDRAERFEAGDFERAEQEAMVSPAKPKGGSGGGGSFASELEHFSSPKGQQQLREHFSSSKGQQQLRDNSKLASSKAAAAAAAGTGGGGGGGSGLQVKVAMPPPNAPWGSPGRDVRGMLMTPPVGSPQGAGAVVAPWAVGSGGSGGGAGGSGGSGGELRSPHLEEEMSRLNGPDSDSEDLSPTRQLGGGGGGDPFSEHIGEGNRDAEEGSGKAVGLAASDWGFS